MAQNKVEIIMSQKEHKNIIFNVDFQSYNKIVNADCSTAWHCQEYCKS